MIFKVLFEFVLLSNEKLEIVIKLVVVGLFFIILFNLCIIFWVWLFVVVFGSCIFINKKF